jgi:ankyrin repeat protein
MKVSLRSAAIAGAILFVGCAGTLRPSRQDPANYSRLEAAVESCDLNKTRTLVATNPQLVNKQGWGELTPLHLAAQNRCPDVTAFLVRQGAQVDAKADGGTTPLHLAAQKGSIEVASVLLAARASINATDARHRTPLDRANAWGQLKMAGFLKQRGGRKGNP